MSAAGQIAFKLAFQLSPILLTRGIAKDIPGGILPIIALTEGANFAVGLVTGSPDIDTDNFFANWSPMPGTSLLNQAVATYPFANQAVAANAAIQQPNQVSMLMTCPARGLAGYATKLATMTALRSALAAHNAAGGTYSVLTPSFVFVDCVFMGMRDVSGGQSAQVQTQFQLDFFQPLVSLSDARSALNGLMQKIQSGLPLNAPTSAVSAAGLTVGKLTAIYPVGSSALGSLVK